MLLVPSPSSYFPRVPTLIVTVGSEFYELCKRNAPCPVLFVRNQGFRKWRRAPDMTVARESPFAGVLDGKIYVMGAIEANDSAVWAEVFDTKTQTWEPLPDPGTEIRFSKFKKLHLNQGRFYLIGNNEEKGYVYDPKQGKWDVVAKRLLKCVVGNTWYGCDKNSCMWYDTKSKEWRMVKGLSVLNMNLRGGCVEIANYRGKLLFFWDKFVNRCRNCQEKYFWCAAMVMIKFGETLSGLVLCVGFLVHTSSWVLV